MRPFVRGDIDGFFGLALDNLVQLLLIDSLCRFVLGLPPEIIYQRILPGAAISLLVGNLYYARQALQLAARTSRTDVCALPYGINTISLFGHVFLVMLPAKLAAEAAGHPDPASVAWQAGLLACLGSGLIEIGGSVVAERIRKATPRAALLATLAGIAITFISLGFLFRTFARPVVGFTTLGIILVTYFGRVRFRGRIPGGLVAVLLGTALGWMTGIAPAAEIAEQASVRLPLPVIGEIVGALREGLLLPYISIILPMGIFNVIGSLQNIESAEAAGDAYETRPSLLVNGAGTVAAAAFGSPFPTTIYIGHPGWKALGARAGYSHAERRVRHDRVPHGYACAHRVGCADRRGYGDRALDRDRHLGAGVPGHASCARASGRDRAAPGCGGLGRAHGQERTAGGWCRHARRPTVLREFDRRVQNIGHVDPRRVRPGTGLHLPAR